MPIEPVTAGIIGGGLVIKGALDWFGARGQRSAAQDAAREARRAGREAAGLVEEAYEPTRAALEGGYADAQNRLGSVDRTLQAGQDDLASMFLQERFVGSQALERLNDVILGGDLEQLQIDPGFAFRQEEGEKAIQRQAAAAGSFGSGGNLKDFARFNQGLASQEYSNAIGRLSGLEQVGSAANRSFATLNQQLLSQRAQIGGNRAQLSASRGAALAQLVQQNATNRANLMTNTAAQSNAFNLQAANAQAQALGGLGDNLLLGGLLYNAVGGVESTNDAEQPKTKPTIVRVHDAAMPVESIKYVGAGANAASPYFHRAVGPTGHMAP